MSARIISYALAPLAVMIPAVVSAGNLEEPVVEPVIAAPATIQPATAWTGFHLGAFVGRGSGDYQQEGLGEPGQEVDASGTLGGLRLGYDRQWQRTVFGADVSYGSGFDGSLPQGTGAGTWWGCDFGDCYISFKKLLTVRARAGYLATDKTLIYATAGYARADIDGGIRNSLQEGSSHADGYTAGLGIEHKVNDRFSIFGEANYVDLGTLEFGIASPDGAPFEGKGHFTTILAGVNFHF